jgi:hypothetical protein
LIESTTGSFWHAIVHRREGDFANSKYWYHRASGHPILATLGWDPMAFVDEVSVADGAALPRLVEMQRRETMSLLKFCNYQHR